MVLWYVINILGLVIWVHLQVGFQTGSVHLEIKSYKCSWYVNASMVILFCMSMLVW